MSGRALNRGQRIITVVGLGVAVYVSGEWLTSLGSRLPAGWVAYAPLESTPTVGGLHSWVRLVIWLALIAAWTASSVALLRTSHRQPPTS